MSYRVLLAWTTGLQTSPRCQQMSLCRKIRVGWDDYHAANLFWLKWSEYVADSISKGMGPVLAFVVVGQLRRQRSSNKSFTLTPFIDDLDHEIPAEVLLRAVHAHFSRISFLPQSK